MMHQIKSIVLPIPCDQSWQEMKPVGDNRYCENCCKTVIDFTQMTNEEILTFLNTKVNVCGRFGPTQLNRLNDQLEYCHCIKFSWKKLSWAALMLMMLPAIKTKAQTKAKTEQLACSKISTHNKNINGNKLKAFKRRDRSRLLNKYDTLEIRPAELSVREITSNKFTFDTTNVVIKEDDGAPLTGMAGGVFVRRSFVGGLLYNIKSLIRSVF